MRPIKALFPIERKVQEANDLTKTTDVTRCDKSLQSLPWLVQLVYDLYILICWFTHITLNLQYIYTIFTIYLWFNMYAFCFGRLWLCLWPQFPELCWEFGGASQTWSYWKTWSECHGSVIAVAQQKHCNKACEGCATKKNHWLQTEHSPTLRGYRVSQKDSFGFIAGAFN